MKWHSLVALSTILRCKKKKSLENSTFKITVHSSLHTEAGYEVPKIQKITGDQEMGDVCKIYVTPAIPEVPVFAPVKLRRWFVHPASEPACKHCHSG